MSAEPPLESVTYLDSSALVKLVVQEPQSAALRRYLKNRLVWASSALSRVEIVRAVRLRDRPAIEQARKLLESVSLIDLDDSLLVAAADLDVDPLRSLDAIHLAAARTLSEQLEAVVTYDTHMPTVSPDDQKGK
jgi:uncharacterized protein